MRALHCRILLLVHLQGIDVNVLCGFPAKNNSHFVLGEIGREGNCNFPEIQRFTNQLWFRFKILDVKLANQEAPPSCSLHRLSSRRSRWRNLPVTLRLWLWFLPLTSQFRRGWIHFRIHYWVISFKSSLISVLSIYEFSFGNPSFCLAWMWSMPNQVHQLWWRAQYLQVWMTPLRP